VENDLIVLGYNREAKVVIVDIDNWDNGKIYERSEQDHALKGQKRDLLMEPLWGD